MPEVVLMPEPVDWRIRVRRVDVYVPGEMGAFLASVGNIYTAELTTDALHALGHVSDIVAEDEEGRLWDVPGAWIDNVYIPDNGPCRVHAHAFWPFRCRSSAVQ